MRAEEFAAGLVSKGEFFRKERLNLLISLDIRTPSSVFRVWRKEVWDASCGISVAGSGFGLTIHALRDQIKEIRIR